MRLVRAPGFTLLGADINSVSKRWRSPFSAIPAGRPQIEGRPRERVSTPGFRGATLGLRSIRVDETEHQGRKFIDGCGKKRVQMPEKGARACASITGTGTARGPYRGVTFFYSGFLWWGVGVCHCRAWRGAPTRLQICLQVRPGGLCASVGMMMEGKRPTG